MTKIITLTRGKFALIDDEDYDRISKHKWQCSVREYAVRTEYIDGKEKTINMHNEVMNAPSGMEVDHIHGNKLDNRKTELRICTQLENSRNRKLHKNSQTGYKGVSWHKDNKKWGTRIAYNNRVMFLGYFNNVIDAARAYDEKAKELFKEFARLNFPEIV